MPYEFEEDMFEVDQQRRRGCETAWDSLHLCCKLISKFFCYCCFTHHDFSWLQVEGWVVHVRVLFDCGRHLGV